MGAKLNRLQRARQNPKGWTAAELRSLLLMFGFREVEGSKHSKFVAGCDPRLRMTVTRSSGEISKLYVAQAVALIDAALAIDPSL